MTLISEVVRKLVVVVISNLYRVAGRVRDWPRSEYLAKYQELGPQGALA
jgi:hypothetical protein